MRIAIASGKGGAGKTTVTASLASVWDRPFIAVDTDVEAPNLHLFLPPAVEASETVGLEVPILDPERCTLCGACRAICRYKAIAQFASRLTIFTAARRSFLLKCATAAAAVSPFAPPKPLRPAAANSACWIRGPCWKAGAASSWGAPASGKP